MNHIKKKWNKILSAILSWAIILSCVPVQPIFASGEIEFDCGNMVEMMIEGETSETQNISINSWWITEPDENLTRDNTTIEWQSDNPDIASVVSTGTTIVEQKAATITANKAGVVNITCTVTYNDGTEGSQDVTCEKSIEVTVKQKPVLTITAVPETSVNYPNKVNFDVISVPDVSVTGQTISWAVTDGNGNRITTDNKGNEITLGTSCLLPVGNYKVTASVADVNGDNGESYLAANTELDYIVAQGIPVGDISGDTQEVYIGQEFTITLPTPTVEVIDINGTATVQNVEGSYTLTLANVELAVPVGEAEPVSYEPGTVVTLKAGSAGVAGVKATFTPTDSTNYSAYDTTQINYNVKKIPVVVEWDSSSAFEKTYDGNVIFNVETDPIVIWGGEYTPNDIQLPTVSSLNDSYEFTLEDKNAGIKTGTLGKDNLILSNTELFEIETDPTISVKVNPIVLGAEYIELTGYLASDKGYDGTSTAKLSSENPKLKNGDKILAADFNSLSLDYEAHYYNDAGNPVSGNPDENTQATQVKFSNIQIMQEDNVSVNYIFARGTAIEDLTGSFIIRANEEFTTFTDLGLGTTVNETYEEKEISIYWINAEGSAVLQKEGYIFSENTGSENEPRWNWIDSYTLQEGGIPKKIYAKSVGDGLVSKGAYVVSDVAKPDGQIYAKVGEGQNEEIVTIQELKDNFNNIVGDDGVQITFAGNDVSSKIAKIECIATDEEWISNDESTWSGKTPTYIFEVNTETEKTIEVIQDVQTIENEDDLKNFYYVRITDYAGNVEYISSTEVLSDVTAPTTTVTLEAVANTFEGKRVYEGNVNFTVTLEDNNISSGIVSVTAVLKKNGIQIATFNTTDNDIWKTSDVLDAINALSEASNPTDDEVRQTEGNIEGTLTGLEEANYYTLQIVAMDKAGHKSSISEVKFIVDKENPIITITDEKTYIGEKGDCFTGGSMTVTVQDYTLSTPIDDLITDIEDEETEWVKTVDAATGFITHKIKLEFGEGAPYYSEEGTYKFKVTAKDVRGGESEESCNEFILDYTAPTYIAEYSQVDTDSFQPDDDENILYYNRDIEATFTIVEEHSYDDSNIKIVVKNSSGREVMEWKNQEEIVKDANYKISHTSGTNQFTFIVKATAAAEDEGYTYEISGTDSAGNVLRPNTEKDKKSVEAVRVLDITKPQLTDIVYNTTNGEDAAELFNPVTKEEQNGTKVRDYINVPINMIFTITEHNPMENSYFLTSKGESVQNNQWSGSAAGTDIYTSAIQVPMNGKGDEQTIQYTIIDKAGNTAVLALSEGTDLRSDNTTFDEDTGVFTDKYTVDTASPKIKYEYVDYNPDYRSVDDVDYFKQDIKVVVTVTEHNLDALSTELVLISEKEENETVIEEETTDDDIRSEFESEWVSNGDIHTKIFTLKGDEQYDITISGNDCANNVISLEPIDKVSAKQDETTKETKLSVAIDKNLPIICDSAKPSVSVSAGTSSTTVGTYAGQQLFGGDVTFKVTVYDPVSPKFSSGIESIKINVKADNGVETDAVINRGGNIASGNGVSINLSKGNPEKLGRGKENTLEYSVTISSSVFNSNNIRLSVVAEDIATNKKEVEAEPVSIDTTPPEVIVTYDNNDVSNLKYLHETRTAMIQVRERNFSDDCMTFTVNGSSVALSFTQTSSGSGNGDDSVWQATYPFEKDDEYILKGECKDRINNVGTVTFEGEAAEEFVIDQTLPTIEIEFDNNNVFNENYFDTQRTATIIITEKNFNPDEVKIIGEGNDAGTAVTYPALSGWSSTGEVHRATINYSQDALYTLDVEYMDLATNEAEDVEEVEFTVDTTDPEIIISGVEEQMPYSGEVRPEISFSDNNYDSHTITMIRTERENIGVDVTEMIIGAVGVSVDGTGKGIGNRVVEDIEHLEENDGIYTLTVNVTDKAGRSSEETITYSVNRFGSVYVYSQDLANMLQGYYQEIEGDLYITAYNANQLVDDSTKLEITCDGSVVENQNSIVDLASGRQTTNGGWYEYRFRLEHDDFKKDGCYEITLSDKDEAGNTRTNSDAPVSFYIDATAPMIDSIIGLEESIVNANEHRIGYAISDAIALESVAVYVNDEQVDKITDFENSTAFENSFILGAGMRQNVRIVAHDKAGNMVDTAAESFEAAYAFNPEITVSTNLLVRWYANTAVFWGSIGAAAVVSGGAITTGVVRVRKKNRIVEED